MKIFEEDEMNCPEVKPEWTLETLLGMEGMFWLKDVSPLLECRSEYVRRRFHELVENGEKPYLVMGVRKTYNHFQVRMTVFAPYYREHLKPTTRKINPEWDANELLTREGLFLLTDVCDHIPFSVYQLRYQAQRNPNARTEYGIWKDEATKRFVVDMKPFAAWIKGLWQKWSQGGEASQATAGARNQGVRDA